ncbi:MAG: phospho-sugar mutase [Actinomycetota bacterium]|nr:phospho-sugar mutase [Actinomycetota bacterium]
MATDGADRPALDVHAPGALLQLARAWLADDPDPVTRDELKQLIDAVESVDGDARADLADRFSGRLVFGTAGLRGALGAGPNRMNRVVVTQAAAGLIAYLLGHDDTGDRPPRVVVGFDARHGSARFAADTAEIIHGAGGEALLLPDPLPTPVLAYAVCAHDCDAGVMVTASHNPPQDNGYKVYLGDGSLIVPPADGQIASAIDRVAAGSIATLPRSQDYVRLGDEVRAGYVDAVLDLVAGGPRTLRLVHTSLHGVGSAVVDEVLDRAGFADRHVVLEQSEPDPDFPTVAFPNPEEPGAMDLALALAAKVDADLVVANDPDADRCAVAVPDRLIAGHWRMLHGDEVGVLLADAVLASGRHGAYAATIVSSSLLGRLVTEHADTGGAVRHEETLTGFKWLTKVDGLAYAYEEALGYCVAPDLVRDKDGISATLLICDLAARLAADGHTLVDRLDEIAARHGLHATDMLSVRVHDLSLISDAMARLRAEPPQVLGGLVVQRVDDLADGSVETTGLAATDGMRLMLAERGRVVVRPSGTEPKLKAYLEVVVPVERDTDGAGDITETVQAARIAAAGRLDAIKTDLAAHLRL